MFLEQRLGLGVMRPSVGPAFAFDRLAVAHRYVEGGTAAGKTGVMV